MRRRRDIARDVALGAILWPLWLLTAGPGIVVRLAFERAHRAGSIRNPRPIRPDPPPRASQRTR